MAKLVLKNKIYELQDYSCPVDNDIYTVCITAHTVAECEEIKDRLTHDALSKVEIYETGKDGDELVCSYTKSMIMNMNYYNATTDKIKAVFTLKQMSESDIELQKVKEKMSINEDAIAELEEILAML